MRTTVKMPRLGDAVNEVVVLTVSVSVGSRLDVGDVLMVVETDKVEAEVPCPVAGTVVEVLVAVDDEVSTGAAVAVLDT